MDGIKVNVNINTVITDKTASECLTIINWYLRDNNMKLKETENGYEIERVKDESRYFRN